MKYHKIAANILRNKEVSKKTTIAIVAGVSVGLAVGALFATKPGRETKAKLLGFTRNMLDNLLGNSQLKAHQKLGSVINDVRAHVKLNAEGLISPK